jgi:hypothetical protein
MKVELALKVTEDSGKVCYHSVESAEGYGLIINVSKEVLKSCIDPDTGEYHQSASKGERRVTAQVSPKMGNMQFTVQYEKEIGPSQECPKCGKSFYNDEMIYYGYGKTPPEGFNSYVYYCKECIPVEG